MTTPCDDKATDADDDRPDRGADERNEVEDRNDQAEGDRVRHRRRCKHDRRHGARDHADQEVAGDVAADGRRDSFSGASDSRSSSLGDEPDERLVPLAPAELHEEGQEENEDEGASAVHHGADSGSGRACGRSNATRPEHIMRPLDDLEAPFEKAEPAVSAAELVEDLGRVVDEARRLVDQRREQEVPERDEHGDQEPEADPDGLASAQSSTLERLDERLGGHREHDGGHELREDRSSRISECEHHEGAEGDGDEENDRPRRDRHRHRSGGRGSAIPLLVSTKLEAGLRDRRHLRQASRQAAGRSSGAAHCSRTAERLGRRKRSLRRARRTPRLLHSLPS